jgi:hypothetical protein
MRQPWLSILARRSSLELRRFVPRLLPESTLQEISAVLVV